MHSPHGLEHEYKLGDVPQEWSPHVQWQEILPQLLACQVLADEDVSCANFRAQLNSQLTWADKLTVCTKAWPPCTGPLIIILRFMILCKAAAPETGQFLHYAVEGVVLPAKPSPLKQSLLSWKA